ncbi:MAG: tRNA preQ1(34) S-adenosylmethionine ribosyltransferase-isomerase QueA [candidate division NC10 bacterium]|nr:tRNA preQ1(34) S-adenosylmethionine ribosyltransferase-isomerase QueA [candidate division NC10 bacterium]
MRLADFDYHLPKELIAQVPLPRRDSSRLLVVHRASSRIQHRWIPDLIKFCQPGDLLILNDAKVAPCRLRGLREASGAKVEVLLLQEREPGIWEVLLKPGSKVRKGQVLLLGGGRLRARVLDEAKRPRRLLQLNANGNLTDLLQECGEMPLPPYIRRDSADPQWQDLRRMDFERYQTVFASHEGAVAAPTAGLHFTFDLLEKLRSHGVQIAYLTLYVGPGTFQPVRVEEITQHVMEAEEYLIPQATVSAIERCRSQGNRVIVVGTTCMRALESAADEEGAPRPGAGVASLFIHPGHRFRVADCLLTNFHLPRSTLLMLVSAFAGMDLCRQAYQEAVSRRYRFYSYGDAMLIL